MFIEMQLERLTINNPRGGVLIFGMGATELYSPLSKLFPGRMHYLGYDQNPLMLEDLEGLTLVVPLFFNHTYQDEVLKLFAEREKQGVNLVILVSSLTSIDPRIPSEEIQQRLKEVTELLQTVIITRCSSTLANHLGELYGENPEQFMNIPINAYQVDVHPISVKLCA